MAGALHSIPRIAPVLHDDVKDSLRPTHSIYLCLRVRPEIPRRHRRLRVTATERHLLQVSVIARDDYHRLRGIDPAQHGFDEILDRLEDSAGQLDSPGVTHQVGE